MLDCPQRLFSDENFRMVFFQKIPLDVVDDVVALHHVVFRRHPRNLVRLLKERSYIHVESQVGIRGGHHFGATVVTILSHLGDKNARAAAMGLGKLVCGFADLVEP